MLLLKDLHAQTEAQRNIAAFLTGLSERSDVLAVVEGAAGPMDFSPYRAFPNPQVTARLAEAYLERDWIQGPELAGLTGPARLSFAGGEDRALYLANVEAYRRAAAAGKEFLPRLEQAVRELEALKAVAYSPAQRRLDEAFKSFQSQKSEARRYVGVLTETGGLDDGRLSRDFPQLGRFRRAARLEDDIDLHRVETERAAAVERLSRLLTDRVLHEWMDRTQELHRGRVEQGDYYRYLLDLCNRAGLRTEDFPHFRAYAQYCLLSDGIDRAAFFDELIRLEQTVWTALKPTPAQENLRRLTRQADLIGKLAGQGLSDREWQDYRSQHGEIRSFGRRLREAGADPSFSWDSAWVDTFEDFYERASQRNEALAGNLLAAREKAGAGWTVLVAGGFHEPGITAILRRKGVGYAVLSPRISRIDPGKNGLEVFTREKTPLDRVFLGEKIFLAKDIAFVPEPLSPRSRVQVILFEALEAVLSAWEIPSVEREAMYARISSLLREHRLHLKGIEQAAQDERTARVVLTLAGPDGQEAKSELLLTRGAAAVDKADYLRLLPETAASPAFQVGDAPIEIFTEKEGLLGRLLAGVLSPLLVASGIDALGEGEQHRHRAWQIQEALKEAEGSFRPFFFLPVFEGRFDIPAPAVVPRFYRWGVGLKRLGPEEREAIRRRLNIWIKFFFFFLPNLWFHQETRRAEDRMRRMAAEGPFDLEKPFVPILYSSSFNVMLDLFRRQRTRVRVIVGVAGSDIPTRYVHYVAAGAAGLAAALAFVLAGPLGGLPPSQTILAAGLSFLGILALERFLRRKALDIPGLEYIVNIYGSEDKYKRLVGFKSYSDARVINIRVQGMSHSSFVENPRHMDIIKNIARRAPDLLELTRWLADYTDEPAAEIEKAVSDGREITLKLPLEEGMTIAYPKMSLWQKVWGVVRLLHYYLPALKHISTSQLFLKILIKKPHYVLSWLAGSKRHLKNIRWRRQHVLSADLEAGGAAYRALRERLARAGVYFWPMNCAHAMGGGHEANTVRSMLRCYEEWRCPWGEGDFRLSKDLEPFGTHNRKINGRPVYEYTSQELEAMGLNKFRHFLEAIRARRDLGHGNGIVIDLKPEDSHEAMMILTQKTVQMIGELGLQDQVMFTSFDTKALERVKQLNPDIPTSLAWAHPWKDPLPVAQRIGADFINPGKHLISRNLVRRAHAAGIGVSCWIVDHPLEMQWLAEIGVDGIGSNYPERVTMFFREVEALEREASEREQVSQPSDGKSAVIDLKNKGSRSLDVSGKKDGSPALQLLLDPFLRPWHDWLASRGGWRRGLAAAGYLALTLVLAWSEEKVFRDWVFGGASQWLLYALQAGLGLSGPPVQLVFAAAVFVSVFVFAFLHPLFIRLAARFFRIPRVKDFLARRGVKLQLQPESWIKTLVIRVPLAALFTWLFFWPGTAVLGHPFGVNDLVHAGLDLLIVGASLLMDRLRLMADSRIPKKERVRNLSPAEPLIVVDLGGRHTAGAVIRNGNLSSFSQRDIPDAARGSSGDAELLLSTLTQQIVDASSALAPEDVRQIWVATPARLRAVDGEPDGLIESSIHGALAGMNLIRELEARLRAAGFPHPVVRLRRDTEAAGRGEHPFTPRPGEPPGASVLLGMGTVWNACLIDTGYATPLDIGGFRWRGKSLNDHYRGAKRGAGIDLKFTETAAEPLSHIFRLLGVREVVVAGGAAENTPTLFEAFETTLPGFHVRLPSRRAEGKRGLYGLATMAYEVSAVPEPSLIRPALDELSELESLLESLGQSQPRGAEGSSDPFIARFTHFSQEWPSFLARHRDEAAAARRRVGVLLWRFIQLAEQAAPLLEGGPRESAAQELRRKAWGMAAEFAGRILEDQELADWATGMPSRADMPAEIEAEKPILSPLPAPSARGLYEKAWVLRTGGILERAAVEGPRWVSGVEEMSRQRPELVSRVEKAFPELPSSINIGPAEQTVIIERLKALVREKRALRDSLTFQGIDPGRAGGLVVTMGSDMADQIGLAVALELAGGLEFPVVLTAADTPPSEPGSDAEANFALACRLANDRHLPPQVYFAFGGDVFLASRIQNFVGSVPKPGLSDHGVNGAFVSYGDQIARQGSRSLQILSFPPAPFHWTEDPASAPTPGPGYVEHIALDHETPAEVVEDAARRIIARRDRGDPAGLILEGGNSRGPQEARSRIIAAIWELSSREIPVFTGSRESLEGWGRECGILFIGKSLVYPKARIKLAWLLSRGIPFDRLEEEMNRDYAGEVPGLPRYPRFHDYVEPAANNFQAGQEVLMFHPGMDTEPIQDALHRLESASPPKGRQRSLIIYGFGDGNYLPLGPESLERRVSDWIHRAHPSLALFLDQALAAARSTAQGDPAAVILERSIQQALARLPRKQLEEIRERYEVGPPMITALADMLVRDVLNVDPGKEPRDVLEILKKRFQVLVEMPSLAIDADFRGLKKALLAHLGRLSGEERRTLTDIDQRKGRNGSKPPRFDLLARRLIKDALTESHPLLRVLGEATDRGIRVEVRTTAYGSLSDIGLYETGHMLRAVGAEGQVKSRAKLVLLRAKGSVGGNGGALRPSSLRHSAFARMKWMALVIVLGVFVWILYPIFVSHHWERWIAAAAAFAAVTVASLLIMRVARGLRRIRTENRFRDPFSGERRARHALRGNRYQILPFDTMSVYESAPPEARRRPGTIILQRGLGAIEMSQALSEKWKVLAGLSSVFIDWKQSGINQRLSREFRVANINLVNQTRVTDALHRDADQDAEELSRVVAYYREKYPGEPVIILGNSMGGHLGFRYLMREDEDSDFNILINPGLRLCEGAARVFEHQGFLRRLLRGKVESPYVRDIMPGEHNRELLRRMQRSLSAWDEEHRRPAPPTVIISTRVDDGDPGVAPWARRLLMPFYASPGSDGEFEPAVQQGLADDGNPIMPGSISVVVHGVRHVAALAHPPIQRFAARLIRERVRGGRIEDLVVIRNGENLGRLGEFNAKNPLVLRPADRLRLVAPLPGGKIPAVMPEETIDLSYEEGSVPEILRWGKLRLLKIGLIPRVVFALAGGTVLLTSLGVVPHEFPGGAWASLALFVLYWIAATALLYLALLAVAVPIYYYFMGVDDPEGRGMSFNHKLRRAWAASQRGATTLFGVPLFALGLSLGLTFAGFLMVALGLFLAVRPLIWGRRERGVGAPKTEVIADQDYDDVVAENLIRQWNAMIAQRGKALVTLPTGNTLMGVYRALLRGFGAWTPELREKYPHFDWAKVYFINLDDLEPLEGQNRENFEEDNFPAQLRGEFINPLIQHGLPPENVHLWSGWGDFQSAAAACEAFIAKHGFRRFSGDEPVVDMALMGIARGPAWGLYRWLRWGRRMPVVAWLLSLFASVHLAYNEAGSAFDSPTRSVRLARSTRRAGNLRYTHGRTLGMRTLLAARQIIVLANDPTKRSAVDLAVHGPVTERVPASGLQMVHEKVVFYISKRADPGALPRGLMLAGIALAAVAVGLTVFSLWSAGLIPADFLAGLWRKPAGPDVNRAGLSFIPMVAMTFLLRSGAGKRSIRLFDDRPRPGRGGIAAPSAMEALGEAYDLYRAIIRGEGTLLRRQRLGVLLGYVMAGSDGRAVLRRFSAERPDREEGFLELAETASASARRASAVRRIMAFLPPVRFEARETVRLRDIRPEHVYRGAALRSQAGKQGTTFIDLAGDIPSQEILNGVLALDMRDDLDCYETSALTLARRATSAGDQDLRVILKVDAAEEGRIVEGLEAALRVLAGRGVLSLETVHRIRSLWKTVPREQLREDGVIVGDQTNAAAFRGWIRDHMPWNLPSDYVLSILTSDESGWIAADGEEIRLYQVLLRSIAVRVTPVLQQEMRKWENALAAETNA